MLEALIKITVESSSAVVGLGLTSNQEVYQIFNNPFWMLAS
jgi:hypothetical protein